MPFRTLITKDYTPMLKSREESELLSLRGTANQNKNPILPSSQGNAAGDWILKVKLLRQRQQCMKILASIVNAGIALPVCGSTSCCSHVGKFGIKTNLKRKRGGLKFG